MSKNPLARHFPDVKNPAMVLRRKISVRSDEERALVRAEREEREREEFERILDALDDWDWDEDSKGGRPSIVLPPEIARRVLADLAEGRTPRAIARKFKATPWAFSHEWVRNR